MTLRVPDTALPSTQNVESAKPVKTAPSFASKTTGTSGETGKGADVSLSQANVHSLTTQLSGLPAIRQERVQQLQTAVKGGTYNPSSQEIANAIHADLFGMPTNSGS